MTKVPRFAALLAGLWLLQVEPARAAFHLVMVTEVFPGFASSSNAQYVELQMYAQGQNFVLGHSVQVYDATGGLIGTFTFDAHAANGDDQASLLIATAEAQNLFGVVADLTMTPLISPAGGKVCFTGSSDCVAWGAYVGSTFGVGDPFSPAGLTLGQTAQRRLDRGSPGILDESDDTNDSATDFAAAPPTPRTNAGVTGATAGYGSTPPPPGPIAFGSVVVGSTVSATLGVHETGGRTLTVSNPGLAGAHPGDFSLATAFPFSLPDGAPAQTVQLTCTPQAEGVRTATLTLATNDPARPTVAYDLTCSGQPAPPSLNFFTVVPCRAVDTRDGGGPVAAGVDRTFVIAGACGVPTTARAMSLNVTVTQPTQAGNVRLFPAGTTVPLVSTLTYAAGQTRANNAVIGLDDDGRLTVRCAPSGSTHLILDVNGYFE
jgi:hypothetical protein